MALQKINSNIKYLKWAEFQKGQHIEGWIKEKKHSARYDNYTLVIENRNGKLQGVPLSGQLKYILDGIEKGAYIQIVYQGKETLKNGFSAHQFEVYRDEEKDRKPGMSKVTPPSQDTSYGDHDDDDDYDDDDYDDVDM